MTVLFSDFSIPFYPCVVFSFPKYTFCHTFVMKQSEPIFISITQHGWTPLMSIASDKKYDVITELLSLGANVNIQGINVSFSLNSEIFPACMVNILEAALGK